MSGRIGRFEFQGREVWALEAGYQAGQEPAATLLEEQPESLRELIVRCQGLERVREICGAGRNVSIQRLRPLAPVTAPCDISAAGLNYRGVLGEMGRKLTGEPPMFFRKAWSTICATGTVVRRPTGERLLDYEVELGLIMGRDLNAADPVAGLDSVAGLVVCNDISAREAQFARGQWYEGKSYRGFCPVGAWITPLTRAVRARIMDLNLRCYVNSELRQSSTVSDMIHSPGALVDALAKFADLRAGDLILTGTPAGTAVGRAYRPSRLERIGRALLPDRFAGASFMRRQIASQYYLRDGDRVRVSIRTPDGSIDLGETRNTIGDSSTLASTGNSQRVNPPA